MVHTEDLNLARRVVSKNREAVNSFFDAYFGRLYRFAALRLDEPQACEDVVQETMIKAIRGLATYRGEAALFSWMCQICRNEISNYFHRYGRKEEKMVSLDDDPNLRAALESLGSDDADDVVNRLTIEKIVQLTLDYLPDKYSKALEWKYLEGLSVDEIAERLDTGVVAAQSILARARNAFRKGYGDVQRELGVSG